MSRSKDLEIMVLRHQLTVLDRRDARPVVADDDRNLLGAIAQALPRALRTLARNSRDALALAPTPHRAPLGRRGHRGGRRGADDSAVEQDAGGEIDVGGANSAELEPVDFEDGDVFSVLLSPSYLQFSSGDQLGAAAFDLPNGERVLLLSVPSTFALASVHVQNLPG